MDFPYRGYTVKMQVCVGYFNLRYKVEVILYTADIIDSDGVIVYQALYHHYGTVVIDECMEWIDQHVKEENVNQ